MRSVSSSSTGWTLLWGDFTTFMTPSSSHPKCLRPTKASIETDSSGNAGYTLPSLPGSYKENPSVVLSVFPLLKPGKAIPLSVPCNKMSEWSRVPLKTLNTLGGHRFMEPFLLLVRLAKPSGWRRERNQHFQRRVLTFSCGGLNIWVLEWCT